MNEWVLSEFRAGDAVEVRSRDEILATLDANGCLDGMPFMPEMLRFCGQRMKVQAVAHKTCDTVRQSGGRRLSRTVHLGSSTCDGSAHGGCEADCNLFWKDAWLKPCAAPAAAVTEARRGGGCTESRLHEVACSGPGGSPASCYSCQATRLRDATEYLPWWDARQYGRDVRTGNHSLANLARVLFLSWVRKLADLPFGYRLFSSLYGAVHRLLTGRPDPYIVGTAKGASAAADSDTNLQPGDWVRVRPLAEIQATLNVNNKNRGLSFDPEMARFSGHEFQVRKRVFRIIEEPTGRMISMKHPCIMLEGVVCCAEYSLYRLFCPRAIPSYWRELWLERVPAPTARSAAAPAVRDTGA
jgi:hypothetical protein